MTFKIYGVLIILFKISILIKGLDQDSLNKKIIEKSLEYLLSVRNENLGWSEGQSGAIVLGILSAKPSWFATATSLASVSLNQLTESNLNAIITRKVLENEVLSAIVKSPDLTDIDSANLAMMTGALQISCFDISSFHGYDLLSVVKDRIKITPPTSPAFPSLALILCNEEEDMDRHISLSQLQSRFKVENRCPFCVETSSLNIQALVCIERLMDSNSDKSKNRIINRLKVQNRKYIDSVQNKRDGGFGTIIATSLAVQAYHLTSSGNKGTFDIDRAQNFLKFHVKSDGSFSNSPLYTALAIPAFSFNTAVTGGSRLNCPEIANKDRNTLTVSYKLYDDVLTKQSIRGSFTSRKGISLFKALTEYSKEHPDILEFEVVKSPAFGLQISRINEFSNDLVARTFWKVSLISKKNGNTKPLVGKGIDRITVSSDVIYQFTFAQA